MSQSDSPSLSETAAIAYAVMRGERCLLPVYAMRADAELRVQLANAAGDRLRVEPLYLRSSLSGSSPEPQGTTFLHIGSDRVWCVACKLWKCCDGDADCPDEITACPIQEGDAAKWKPVTVEQAQEAIDALAREFSEADDDGARQIKEAEAESSQLRSELERVRGELDTLIPHIDGDTLGEDAGEALNARYTWVQSRASGPSLTEASDSGTTKTAPSDELRLQRCEECTHERDWHEPDEPGGWPCECRQFGCKCHRFVAPISSGDHPLSQETKP